MALFRRDRVEEELDNEVDVDVDGIDSEEDERDPFDNGGEDTDTTTRTIDELVDDVIDYFTQVDPSKINMVERGKLSKEVFLKDVEHYIKKLSRDKENQAKIMKAFTSFVYTYDILDEIIEDREISDIKIYDWDRIRVKRNGKRETSPLKFRNPKHFEKFVEHVATKNKQGISMQNALNTFTDIDSSPSAILRFALSTDFVTSSRKPLLSIRKIPKIKLTREELIKAGFFTAEQADYLENRAKTGGGMLFTGQGSSGKTTCMNYLIDFIPHQCSGFVIQENEELFSKTHPDLAFEHVVTAKGEGKISYSLKDLAKQGLLMDIDYFVIGEIKGDEAVYLLNAVYTGAKGWASVHGASAKEAMKKLVDYIKYNSDYTQKEALEMLVHLDTVIFMKKFHVEEIVEVEGFDEESGKLIYKDITL